MKLIIDIDERAYKASLELKSNDDMGLLGCHLINATANGTPLPKGHGDLIDRDLILQGEHFVMLGDIKVGDKNFGKHEIDMFPKQTIMSVKPVIEADKGE